MSKIFIALLVLFSVSHCGAEETCDGYYDENGNCQTYDNSSSDDFSYDYEPGYPSDEDDGYPDYDYEHYNSES